MFFSNTLKFYFLWETVYYIACLLHRLMWVTWNNLKIYFINFIAYTHIQYTSINYIYQHLFLSYRQYLSNFLSNYILSCFLPVIRLFSKEICSMSFFYIQCKFIIKCQKKCKLHLEFPSISLRYFTMLSLCWIWLYLIVSFYVICENMTNIHIIYIHSWLMEVTKHQHVTTKHVDTMSDRV